MNRKLALLPVLAVLAATIHDATAQSREQLLEENRQLTHLILHLLAFGGFPRNAVKSDNRAVLVAFRF